MDDPHNIATLLATSSDLAKRAFQLDHNRQRYLPPADDQELFNSRESTPLIEDEADINVKYEHRLVLSFRSLPKDPRRGFVFGAGARCDIRLADKETLPAEDRRKIRKISQEHFSIRFDARRRMILQDMSVNGTIVSFDGQAQKQSRTNFQWIIFPSWDTVEVSIPGTELTFQIQLGIHETCEAEFFANVDKHFLNRVGIDDGMLAFPMLQLGVESGQTSVATSGMVTPRRGPIYLLHGEIGRGAFGRVYKVLDVSSGIQYAGKTFHGSRYAREVAILRSLKHEHIVTFVDFRLEPSPLLVMEYFPLGNLDDLLGQMRRTYNARTLPIEDVIACSCQLLEAVAYAHAHRVVHRDIKPANILLFCRDPLGIKLADFGLAKGNITSSSMVQSFLGTHLYVAPEVYEGNHKPYSYVVDVWSIGVVILQLAFGLPKHPSGCVNPINWQKKLLSKVEGLRPDDMAELLAQDMLQVQPDRRSSARACLLKIREKEHSALSTDTSLDSLTPTEAASVLSTIMWLPESSRKRQRSPDSENGAEYASRRTITNDPQLPARHVQTYTISKASLFYSGGHGPMYEIVLELLRELRLGKEDQPDDDVDTIELLRALCAQLRRLHIVEIEISFHSESGQTILTATTNVEDFTLASLTSSDREGTVAQLAEHLTGILLLRKLRCESSSPESLAGQHFAVTSKTHAFPKQSGTAASTEMIGTGTVSSVPRQLLSSGFASQSVTSKPTALDDCSGDLLP